MSAGRPVVLLTAWILWNHLLYAGGGMSLDAAQSWKSSPAP